MRDFLYSEISQIEAFPTSRITLTVPLKLGVSFANYCWSRSKIVLAGSAFALPIGLRQSMRRAQKIKINIVAPQMRATTVGIFGITWIPTAIWVRPLVLWCRRCCPGMRSGRTGRRWLGGFTTICHTPANSGFPNWRRSIYGGARTRTRCLYKHLCGKPAYWR